MRRTVLQTGLEDPTLAAESADLGPRVRTAVLTSGITILALGAIGGAALYFDIPRLSSWIPGAAPMAYSTALTFLVLSTALVLLSTARRRTTTRLAAFGAVIPAVALMQDAIELVHSAASGTDATAVANLGSPQMAPNTALCMLLLFGALFLLGSEARLRSRARGVPLLVSLALGLSVVSAVGYGTGFSTFGWGRFFPMALPTSFGLSVVGLTCLLVHWNEHNRVTGDLPPWLHIMVAVTGIVMTVSLYFSLVAEERTRIEKAVTGQLDIVRSTAASDMQTRLASLGRVALRWERGGVPDPLEAIRQARKVVEDIEGLDALAWTDATARVLGRYPETARLESPGSNPSTDKLRAEAVVVVRGSLRTALTAPLQGGNTVEAYVPMRRGTDLGGLLVARFDLRKLLRNIITSRLAPGFAATVHDGSERIDLQADGNDRGGVQWEREAVVTVANRGWAVGIRPTAIALDRLHSSAPAIGLFSGIAVSLLLGWAVFLVEAARSRTRLSELARTRLEAEIEQREAAEQTLDQFFDVSPDMLCLAGFDGYFKKLNPAWQATLGWSTGQLLEQPFASFVHPDDLEATTRVAAEQQHGDVVRSFENRYRTPDGSYRWLQWYSRADLARGIMVAAARDITGEKAAREALLEGRTLLEARVAERTRELERTHLALRQSDELFRRMFEESPIGIVFLGIDHTISRTNRAFCDLVRYGADEVIGRSIIELDHPDDRAADEEGYRRLYAGEISSRRLDKRYLRKDGETVWARVTSSLIRGPTGQLTGFGLAEDITERVRGDAEIARLNGELQIRVDQATAANQELESFNYSVSHDLRAPLRHMDGFSKILLDKHGPSLTKDAAGCVLRIRDSARRMGRMVDELLELSRSSRREVNKQPTPLRPLVDEVIDELRPEILNREVCWEIGELPTVDCDPTLVRQVFANLLSRAASGFLEKAQPGIHG